MKLEMVNEKQIEILNGGETSVNCKIKSNQTLNLNLYREILVTSEFQSNQNLYSTLYRETPKNLSSLILTIWLKSPHHSGFFVSATNTHCRQAGTCWWEHLFSWSQWNSMSLSQKRDDFVGQFDKRNLWSIVEFEVAGGNRHRSIQGRWFKS